MKLFWLLPLALPFWAITPAFADDSRPPLTVAEATSTALARNPGIQDALAQWEAAKERVIEESAWDDLQVSAVSRLERFVSVPRNGFADETVSVSQLVPVTGKNRLRARAAASEALMAYEDARRRELDVVAETRASYYKLANARAQVELTRRNLVLLQQIAEVSRARYEAGGESIAEVLVAETEEGKLLESAKDLDRAVVAAQTQLNIEMGRDPFAPVAELDDEGPRAVALPVEGLRELTLANRPELRSAQDRVEAARARLELAHRAWIPDPALTIEGQRYNGAAQGVSEVDAGISFNIPWTNAPKYAAGTREAASNLTAAEDALTESRQEALGLLRNALEDIATAQHHQHLSGDALLTQANEGLKASEIGYEAGKVTLSDWMMAAQSLVDVQSMRLQETANYRVAVAELEAVVGAPVTKISNNEVNQ
jgi:cobalt-zinc-cadmium efflux system outer membrane protein